MISYRKAEKKDFEKIYSLCIENNIAFSGNNLLFLAENEQGEIIGICGLKQEWRVEPLIAENPLVGNNLVKMIEGAALANGINVLKANVESSNEKHIKQLEKFGFVIVENSKIILEKCYG